MNTFNREQFNFDGLYLTYDFLDGERGAFVGRFKYNRSIAKRFITFLIKNITVTEYFNLLETGQSPMKILMDRGFKAVL
tara:strand:- start:337 stop:573 length:237 start_codon:yes stop_codon:yes gene_type:complete